MMVTEEFEHLCISSYLYKDTWRYMHRYLNIYIKSHRHTHKKKKKTSPKHRRWPRIKQQTSKTFFYSWKILYWPHSMFWGLLWLLRKDRKELKIYFLVITSKMSPKGWIRLLPWKRQHEILSQHRSAYSWLVPFVPRGTQKVTCVLSQKLSPK